MQADEFAELERRIEGILGRLEIIEGYNGRGWLQRNVSLIISTGTILVTLAAGWARLETTVANLHTTDIRIESRVDRNTGLISAHHENTDIHVDKSWKESMRNDIGDIRQLLIEHMGDR